MICFMPTGPKHIYAWEARENGEWVHHERECRCTIGDDHHESDDQGYSFDDAGNMHQFGEPM